MNYILLYMNAIQKKNQNNTQNRYYLNTSIFAKPKIIKNVVLRKNGKKVK